MFMRRVGSVIRLLKLIFLMLLAGNYAIAEDDWVLERNSDGIQVFTQNVKDSPFDAVRAVMVVEAKLNALVGLVRDAAACPEWAELCKESRNYEVVSEQELYVYSYNDIPWPVKDRDALTHVVWNQDPETLAVTMTAVATRDLLPVTKGAVRIVNAKTRWIFTPTENGNVEVISEAHIDPNGPTPAWITNLLLVETPFKTLQGMRRLVQTGRYDESEFSFLRLP